MVKCRLLGIRIFLADLVIPQSISSGKYGSVILHVQETERGESPEFAATCLLAGEETLKQYGFTPIKKMAKGDFVEEILKAVVVKRYDLLLLGAYGHKKPK